MTLLIIVVCAVAAYLIYKRASKKNDTTGTGTGSTDGGDSPNEVQE